MGTLVDITGERFGMLTVLKRSGSVETKPTWLCLCDCGNVKVIKGASLRYGHTKSCGCLVVKQYCLVGHDTSIMGRTKDRICKACSVPYNHTWLRKYKNRLRNRIEYKNQKITQLEAELKGILENAEEIGNRNVQAEHRQSDTNVA